MFFRCAATIDPLPSRIPFQGKWWKERIKVDGDLKGVQVPICTVGLFFTSLMTKELWVFPMVPIAVSLVTMNSL